MIKNPERDKELTMKIKSIIAGLIALVSIHLRAMEPEKTKVQPKKSGEYFLEAAARLEPKARHIDLKVHKDLDDKGLMSSDFLRRLLTKAYQGHRFLGTILTDPKLHIKRLSEEKSEARWGTTQLFLAETPQESFIVKGMKDAEAEMANLAKATKLPALSPFFYPNDNYEYPQFVFPIEFLSYEGQKGKKHYLSIMPKAPGISLVSLFKDFVEEPGNRKVIEQVARSYFSTGAAMARFYRKTDRKITQGDFHAGNIFWDPKTGRIIIIDNERIITSMNKGVGICEDIAFLTMKSLFVIKWTNPNLLKELRAAEWYGLYLPSFIAGYISIFPRDSREAIFDWLVKCITTYKSTDTKTVWYADESIIGFSHQKYMEPILSSLRKYKTFLAIDSEAVYKRDKNQKTLLHQAALAGETLAIWPLVVAGAVVDARDNQGNTPLHEASYYNHPEVIKALIRAGADIYAKNNSGETPLAKAKANKSNEAVQILQHYGASY